MGVYVSESGNQSSEWTFLVLIKLVYKSRLITEYEGYDLSYGFWKETGVGLWPGTMFPVSDYVPVSSYRNFPYVWSLVECTENLEINIQNQALDLMKWRQLYT
jgi:hypothetical protein